MKMRSIRKNEDRDSEIPANWNNPFAALKIDLPKSAPVPPPPPPPSKEERQKASLSDEDRKLLAVFDDGTAIEHQDSGAPLPKNRLSFQLQRKGKGGKCVTIVHGLNDLELTEQMDLCSRVKTALGCGARFLEGDLEIQGEQIPRAKAWFEKNGFKI